MRARDGVALLEVMTSAVLLGIVCATCTMLLRAQTLVLRNSAEHAAGDEALRTGRVIVGGELRALTRADVYAVGKDSIALRAFRGWAIVCDGHNGQYSLRYRGLRDPDAAKDSLLVFGTSQVAAFKLVTRTACVLIADEQAVQLTTTLPLSNGAIVLLFESGAYSLGTNALRYHRGAEARQPMTDELVDVRGSAFAADTSGNLALTLRTRPDGPTAGRLTRMLLRRLN
jgi:hypothetical protein